MLARSKLVGKTNPDPLWCHFSSFVLWAGQIQKLIRNGPTRGREFLFILIRTLPTFWAERILILRHFFQHRWKATCSPVSLCLILHKYFLMLLPVACAQVSASQNQKCSAALTAKAILRASAMLFVCFPICRPLFINKPKSNLKFMFCHISLVVQ